MKRIAIAITVILGVLLLYVHYALPKQLERSFNVNLEHPAYVISAEAQALHESLFIADLHSDSLLWKRDFLERSNVGHMDLPRLQEGNVALQVFSAVTKSPSNRNYDSNEADSDEITLLAIASFWPPKTWRSLYERARYQLDKLHELSSESNLTLVTNKAEFSSFVMRRQRGEPVIAAIYLIEGAHPLEGDLEKLDGLYEQGLRISGLTHFFDNELGGSLHGVSNDGLSEFGIKAVQRMNQKGIIIDVAHASPQMVREVLKVSSRPVILSHGGVKGVCDTPRNLDDGLMQEIAAAGGLVGIGYWRGAICGVTPEAVVESIRYAIDLLGAEHVALGSDYDGSVAVSFDTSQLAVLTQAMLNDDFTETEIRQVMGENAKRFFLENLPD